MTDEQILATAEATGMMLNRFVVDKKQFEFCLLAFAKQIAKLEREACAKACAELVNEENSEDYRNAANWCSVRIRARGEQA
jgi:hypothetical protein